MKPYKAVPPLQTINQIRTILESLNIITTEYHVGMDNFYHSCRIIISNEDIKKLNIGTNGKGIKIDYALASAYGELMERIQNRMILKDMFYATSKSLKLNQNKYPFFFKVLKNNGWELNYRYYPDEIEYQIQSWEELEKKLKIYLPNAYYDALPQDLKKISQYTYNVATIEAPYYNVIQKRIENIPLQLIRLSAGSTGLCAGNTPEEAILQGINEIFERFVLQQIYLHQITPPTIPNSYFSNNEVLEKLELLKKSQNILYEIKDCSLDKGFPVIGLLLIDTKNNSYTFRLGADANPDIALQRCYTEAFQGINMNKYVFNSIEFEDTHVDYSREYNQNVINGSGRFPNCIFTNTPTYTFKQLTRMNRESDKEELKEFLNFLKQNNYTLFVRDNSFLNFPAYHLYIPGLSDVSSRLYKLPDFAKRLQSRDFTYEIPLEYHIKTLNNNELKDLYHHIENRSENKISLFPYYTGLHNTIDKKLLLTLIAFKLSDLDSAFKQMSSFIQNNKNIERYYYAFRDYLYWRKHYSNDNTSLQNILERIYGKQLTQEIIHDMSNNNAVFQYFKFPNCFNCDQCEVRNQCSFFTVLKIDVQIQNAYKKNIPNQLKLRRIFEQ